MVKIQEVNSIDYVLIEIWDGGDRSIDLILFQVQCGVKLGPVFIWPDSAVSPVLFSTNPPQVAWSVCQSLW